MIELFGAGLESIEVSGATAKVYTARPPDSTLTLPTPGLNGHNGPVLIVYADLSVGGDYDLEIGSYDATAGAGNRFTAEETIGTVQSEGPTANAWIYRTLPPNKALRITGPGAGFGYVRTMGLLVQTAA